MKNNLRTSRLLPLLLTLGLLLSLLVVPAAAWDGSSADSFDGGTGTRTDPYLISTPAQLALFRDQVNNGKSGICAKQTANLDMEMRAWDPIGLTSTGFTGIYDGSGYAIQNLNINRYSTGSSSGSGSTLYGGGLFGVVGRNGMVKHVNVGGVVSGSGSYNKNIDVGAICGGNLGTVEECFSTCTFRDFNVSINSSGWTNIGGVVGFNGGTVRNCYMVGSMDVSVQAGSGTNSVNVSGIVGKQDGSGAVLQNCYSVVSIRANSNRPCYVGGVIGLLTGGKTCDNLYTNQDLCDTLLGSGSSSKFTNSALLSTADMKSSAMVSKLGNAFAMDTGNNNQGYPVLAVMVYEEEGGWSEWFEDEVNGTAINKELFAQLTPPELKNRDLTAPITRSEFAAVAVQLYEQMGGKVYDPEGLTTPFTDTSSDAITKAYAIGITNGTSPTTFSPYNKIERQDIATMLTRVYKSLALEGWTLPTDSQFTLGSDLNNVPRFADDGDIGDYARDSVYFMVKHNVIRGVSANTFAPRNKTSSQAAIGYANATREQSIILAIRMFQKLDV